MTPRRSRVSGRHGPRLRRATTTDRSAALVVRVWFEDDAQAFRGRLTAVETWPGGPDAEEVSVAVAACPGDVVDAVRDWLDRFVDDVPGRGDGGG
ncbi:hypothetical protein ACWKWC_01355 [Geodermatophilus nigrescens]|uniref:hypothetical protein n=1 Tax=Geodermatophilus sp. FMUSA9-8 TaxID=3120155 RepID=UPI003009A1E6